MELDASFLALDVADGFEVPGGGKIRGLAQAIGQHVRIELELDVRILFVEPAVNDAIRPEKKNQGGDSLFFGFGRTVSDVGL